MTTINGRDQQMSTVDTCTHPADKLSKLKSGATVCTTCQGVFPPGAPPAQRVVCADAPESVPAAVRAVNTAHDNGWTTQLVSDPEGTVTLRLERGTETGFAQWKQNDDGAWRFSACLIGGQRFGAREINARLNRPVPEPAPVAPAYVPAQPGQTPGELVPGEDDITPEPVAQLATVTPIRPDVVPLDRAEIVARANEQWPVSPTAYAGASLLVPPIPAPVGLSPLMAAALAPPPPSAPGAPVMPTGTLASFMAAPVKATKARGNTEWARNYADTLRDIIEYHGNNSPRNLQVHLGPSELGVPCDRQVAGKIAGVAAVNHVVDPWPSILGTAGHAWLADAFAKENERHGLRWMPEYRVSPHPDHPGTADLYDGIEECVNDWKIVGADKLDKIRVDGPSIQYQIQLLLYGKGYKLTGLPVRRVALVALPRTKASLDDMYVWDHEWTSADDDAIEEVFKLTAIRKGMAQDIIDGRARLLDIPARPDSDTCYFCPFYRPASAQDGGVGCPGTVAA